MIISKRQIESEKFNYIDGRAIVAEIMISDKREYVWNKGLSELVISRQLMFVKG